MATKKTFSVDGKRMIRGAILRLLYQRHEEQKERYRSETLMGPLSVLGFHLYSDILIEQLQTLSDAQLVKYREIMDTHNGEIHITEIQLTPRGRNIVEKLDHDISVDV